MRLPPKTAVLASAVHGDDYRTCFDLTELGLPEIPVFGVDRFLTAGVGLEQHQHPGCMEICHLVQGRRVYRVDGRNYDLVGGDVFLTHADEWHGSAGAEHGRGQLYWMQCRLPRKPASFLCLEPPESELLAGHLFALPHRHFPASLEMKRLFEETLALIQGAMGPLQRQVVANRLHQWLLAVIHCALAVDRKHETADITHVRQLLLHRVDHWFSIDEMAEAAGLSPSRFKSKFREQTGIPPGEYMLRCKVEAAAAMIERRHGGITDIAFQLGFSSSQYFATVFKRLTGRRPSDLLPGRQRREQTSDAPAAGK